MSRRNRTSRSDRESCNTSATAWDELVAHEPELNDLLIEARSMKGDERYFCNHEAYALGFGKHQSFKKRIHRLVGYGATKHRNSFLATSQAYDEVAETLLNAMPPCRNCGCMNECGEFIF